MLTTGLQANVKLATLREGWPKEYAKCMTKWMQKGRNSLGNGPRLLEWRLSVEQMCSAALSRINILRGVCFGHCLPSTRLPCVTWSKLVYKCCRYFSSTSLFSWSWVLHKKLQRSQFGTVSLKFSCAEAWDFRDFLVTEMKSLLWVIITSVPS